VEEVLTFFAGAPGGGDHHRPVTGRDYIMDEFTEEKGAQE
jgi:hypothetical protein